MTVTNRSLLLVLSLGIYGVYLYQGLLLEQLHSEEFAPGARWTFSESLMLVTLLGNIGVAAAGVIIWRPAPCLVPQSYFVAMSVPLLLAGILMFAAMSFRIPYPTLTLLKSGKPLAVLLVALLAGQGVLYSWRQRVVVICVSCGLAIFFLGREGVAGAAISAQEVWGYCGIVGALVCDGFVALAANRVARHVAPPSQLHMQLFTNSWSLLFVLFFAGLSGRLMAAVRFAQTYPAVVLHLVKLGLVSGVGQLFIFATMTWFDPLVLSLVTSTRKIFTIILSAFMFSHVIHPLQWFGVAVVFAGLLWPDVLELLKRRSAGKATAVIEIV